MKNHIYQNFDEKVARIVRKETCRLFTVKIRKEMATSSFIKCWEEFKHLMEKSNDLFVEELPEDLPPNRELDFYINLKTDEVPPVSSNFTLSEEELWKLKKKHNKLM